VGCATDTSSGIGVSTEIGAVPDACGEESVQYRATSAVTRGRGFDTLINTFTRTLSDTPRHSLTLLSHKAELFWHSLTIGDAP